MLHSIVYFQAYEKFIFLNDKCLSIPPHCTRPSSLDNAGQQQQQRQHEECMQSIHQVSGSLYCKDHFRISTWIRGLAGCGGTRRPHRIRRVHNTLKSKKQCTIFYLFWITHPTRQLGVLSKRDTKKINALFFSFRTLHCGLLSKI